MKLICDRLALLDALSATSSVTSTRTPKPILQCVRLTAEKDQFIVTAYDQEVGLRYRVQQVDVTKPGETLVGGEYIRVGQVPPQLLCGQLGRARPVDVRADQ